MATKYYTINLPEHTRQLVDKIIASRKLLATRPAAAVALALKETVALDEAKAARKEARRNAK